MRGYLRNDLLRRNTERTARYHLHDLIERERAQDIKALQSNEIRTPESQADYGAALLYAIECGKDEIALALIDSRGIDLSVRNEEKWTPLTLAIAEGKTEVVQKLLERDDIEVNGVRGFDYGLPIFEACKREDLEILQMLLASENIDVNATDNCGRTALHLAAENRHVAAIQALLDDGRVDKQAQDDQSLTAISIALEAGSFDAISLLWAHGSRFLVEDLLEESSAGHVFGSHRCKDGGREIHTLCACAAACGELELVEQLLGFTSENTLTESMHMAEKNGEAEIEDLLLMYTTAKRKLVDDVVASCRQERKRKKLSTYLRV
ncbi:uncharacterized protein LMH87_007559 [Akanthomyces muscarius]|uniref:Ankyrin repeat protein n=1 Tax=Akanthomyces muscarius TaxID=2231603 RepID=A0A9W8QMS6_AKAMU|nr:uncharacterized protein LMH87_007559 [Akanthomyces muscarius]KAJ4161523.1 hypothetical protein LMH87_007559 [Akanthomyces muscarius]